MFLLSSETESSLEAYFNLFAKFELANIVSSTLVCKPISKCYYRIKGQ